ncbi:MAG: 1-deoxy-D-xylulose-5-phosphate reductoisomerase [Gammaproteobacteria bacterium RIFCSPHIGHO2_12_FULL_41_15]|nr:MAG: 1-deoxy-D-xylulose-5-phosphate reductoisomerase [Gammaproteobacteria bacterium RIFCSPHIGHO2_12_FULL_41_15]
MTTKTLTILGSTGSIGQSTLSVVDKNPDIKIFALTAKSNAALLFTQCKKYQPQYAVLLDSAGANDLQQQLKAASLKTQVLTGAKALSQVASVAEVDTVMAAIVGTAGLAPTLAAAKAGKRILLANKESLVMTGHLFMQTVQQSQACLLPVDSEHNAIWQSLPLNYCVGTRCPGVDKIILTASGGPFLHKPLKEFDAITPAQAIAHPNWSMGAKISVDSATMMNKGLEFIEAHWLFAMPAETIDVIIHPQSLIHSMVQYADGSILSQMGPSDMRVPISAVLGWPKRIPSNVAPLDLLKQPSLHFEALDEVRYPCFRLAKQAFIAGGAYPCVLNAANEVAVSDFMAGKIKFTQIAEQVDAAMQRFSGGSADTLEDLVAIDQLQRI